jgi:pyrroline-5-carboxylate reductase
MAEAICRAVVANNVFPSSQITAWDPAEKRRRVFRTQFGIELSENNAALTRQSDTIVLAVKPQQMAEALDQIRPEIASDQLLISVAAGISTRFLQTALAKPIPIIRVMPNTPLLVGSGMTALSPGEHAGEDHMTLARTIFGLAGATLITDETYMDAITAMSGSGPAYFFYLMEAMVQAGLDLGLSRSDALRLTAQTCLGAGKMVLETQAEPEELRRRVTSPGGTTEAALAVLEADRVKKIFVDAIKAASRRSKQLGR